MDQYPGASYRPILVNYTSGRSGRVPLLIVDHIADGYGSPWGWFNTDRGDAGSSAHFWVSRTGVVEQYRPLSDTCWANGPKNKPDLTVPLVAYLVKNGFIGCNSVSVAIEHEGKPFEPLTDAQVVASARLHAWLSEQFKIPLDRNHVIGHYQLDSVTRANCPGPLFPWARVLKEEKMAFDIVKFRDRLWGMAVEAELNGYPWLAAAIRAVAVLSKGEK